jgi:hypothetical protein
MTALCLLLFAVTPLPVGDAQVYVFKHNSPELGIRKGNEGVDVMIPVTATKTFMQFGVKIPDGWGIADVLGSDEREFPPFDYENRIFWHRMKVGETRTLTVRLYRGLGAANLAKRIKEDKEGKEFKIWIP